MAQCNLFRSLKTAQSNFFLFSQFGDDLTKEYTQKDQYRLMPSRYACLELDVDTWAKTYIKSNKNATIADLDLELASRLQNHYENAVVYNKFLADKDADTVEYAQQQLWNVLQSMKLISKVDSTMYFEQLKYIGDINIYSNNRNDDGINYNEIFCTIPSSARRSYYNFNFAEKSLLPAYNNTDDYIWGWSEENKLEGMDLPWKALFDDSNNKRYYNAGPSIAMEGFNPVCKPTDESSFNFNCVIVFYDICKKSLDGTDVQTLHYNVPMGIYFTGSVQQVDGKHSFKNEITQWATNEDIYNNGTSYTLRIGTRYLTTQMATRFDGTLITIGEGHPEYSSVMQSMGDTLQEMRAYNSKNAEKWDYVKSHLAKFRNSLTNVPYILKTDNGEYHWFVNGKDTGAVASTGKDWDKIIKYEEGKLYGELWFRTPDMYDMIAAGTATDNATYILRYDGDESEDWVYIRQLRIADTFQIWNGEEYMNLDDYIKSITTTNAKGVTFENNRLAANETYLKALKSVYTSLNDTDDLDGTVNRFLNDDITNELLVENGTNVHYVLTALINKVFWNKFAVSMSAKVTNCTGNSSGNTVEKGSDIEYTFTGNVTAGVYDTEQGIKVDDTKLDTLPYSLSSAANNVTETISHSIGGYGILDDASIDSNYTTSSASIVPKVWYFAGACDVSDIVVADTVLSKDSQIIKSASVKGPGTVIDNATTVTRDKNVLFLICKDDKTLKYKLNGATDSNTMSKVNIKYTLPNGTTEAYNFYYYNFGNAQVGKYVIL